MAGEIEPQGLLLARQTLLVLPVGPDLGCELRIGRGHRHWLEDAEEIDLTSLVRGVMLLGELERARQVGHEGGAVRPELIERPGPDQGLEDTPIGLVQIDPPAEIPEIAEGSSALARLDDRLDGALADPLDGPHAIDHGP